MGTLVRRRETWRYSALKVMKFDLLMEDIPVYVCCKFEMYIFKIALVISKNVCIAFLSVLSIIAYLSVVYLQVQAKETLKVTTMVLKWAVYSV